jgi:prepilin-type N-terminal cleavage/methylation domain-containing protein
VTIRRSERRTRAHQKGLTLIELIVTMSLMSIGFLSLLAAFSSIELTVAKTSDDAQLTSQDRQIQDYIESENLTYVECASAADYQSALAAAQASGAVLLPGEYHVWVDAVAEASSGSDSNGPLQAINNCSGTPDYGVQQIKFHVSSPAGISLTRIVYKRWN